MRDYSVFGDCQKICSKDYRYNFSVGIELCLASFL